MTYYIETYRGFRIIRIPGAGCIGIEGYQLYLTTVAVARRCIDTYLERTEK